MTNRIKMIVGIALVVGIVSIALVALPIQAYMNGSAKGDLLRTQDRDQLRTDGRDCICDRTCDCTDHQSQVQQRLNECAANGTINSEQYMYQYRYQYRYG